MKQILRPSLAAVAVIAALGLAGISQAQTAPATKVTKAQASQILGYEMAGSFPQWAHDMVDPKLVGDAVTRALQNQKPTLTEDQLKTAVPAFQQELAARAKSEYEKVAAQNKSEGAAYLAKNKTQPGVHVTADGLQYQVVSQGSGPKPKATDTVQINYTGSFVNGEVFDASAKHGSGPSKFDLGSVFPGFKEALMLMPVGSHYKLAIPSDLAYGSQPRNFPPNATLLFDVTLVKIGAN